MGGGRRRAPAVRQRWRQSVLKNRPYFRANRVARGLQLGVNVSRVAWVACAYVAGLFARSLLHTSLQLGWLAMGALFVGGLLASRTPRSQRETQILLTVGAFAAAFAHGPAPPHSAMHAARGTMRISGVVESMIAANEGNACIVRVITASSIDGHGAAEPNARVRASPCSASAASEIQFVARVAPLVRFRNPAPSLEWPASARIDYHASVMSIGALRVVRQDSFASWLELARESIRAALRKTLSPRTAGIAQALVLGDAEAVDDADTDHVRAAGMSHVLAVSGMHVAILVGMFVAGVRRILLHVSPLGERCDVRRIACAIGAPAAILYAEFAGASPSAYRAGIAAALAWILVALNRRPRPGPIAGLVAVLMTAANPTLATSPAFLLSSTATASLIAWQASPPTSLGGLLRHLAEVATRAWLATLPVLLWRFGNAPLVSIAANAILVPLGGVVLLPAAALHATIALLSPSLAPPSAALLETSTRAFVVSCEYFAHVGTRESLPPLSALQIVVLTAACVALLVVERWRTRATVVLAAAVGLALLEAWLRHSEQPVGILRATFLDVWQGDSTLIDLPDGRLMLVDAGGNPEHGPDPGERVILPLLRARRRDRIDVLVLTHPHPDHYGGIRALLGRVAIGELWDSGQAESEPGHDEAGSILERARSLGIQVRGPRELCGGHHQFRAAEVRVLAPCPRFDSGYDPNDNSIVLELRMGDRRILLVGDAEAHEEELLLASSDLRHVDLLKVGHHGSRTSSTESFLARTEPSYAIVSSGRGNRFQHPHDEVLIRLAAHHTRIVRLDDRGGTIVETDGHDFRVHGTNE